MMTIIKMLAMMMMMKEGLVPILIESPSQVRSCRFPTTLIGATSLSPPELSIL